MKQILSLFESACKTGIYFPFANDPDKGGPSVTLFFTYVAFFTTLGSIALLYFNPDLLTPALFSLSLFIITLVMYRMRALDHVKFDLDDKSFELNAEDEPKK